jgi:hypothetical protein
MSTALGTACTCSVTWRVPDDGRVHVGGLVHPRGVLLIEQRPKYRQRHKHDEDALQVPPVLSCVVADVVLHAAGEVETQQLLLVNQALFTGRDIDD